MFPLQLLSLLFISVANVNKDVNNDVTTATKGQQQQQEGEEEGAEDEQKKKKEKERKKSEKEKTEKHTELQLDRGDLLEVPRTLFTHFGIYLGEGRVAHFIPDILPLVSDNQTDIRQMVTNMRLVLGVIAKCGSVRIDCLEDFAYGSEILINTMDKVCSRPPLQSEAVARRAESMLGNVCYSLLWYNCEHYVMFCRYGTVLSFQTFQFCKTVRSVLLSRRVAKVTAALAVMSLPAIYAVCPFTAAFALLMPFLIWMAS